MTTCYCQNSYPKGFTLLACMISIAVMIVCNLTPEISYALSPKKYALLIGVQELKNKYVYKLPEKDRFGPLPQVANDIEALKNILYKNGYIVKVLKVTSEEKPTSTEIIKRISSIVRETKTNDTLIVYFSGHGYGNDDENYLIPYEYDPLNNPVGTRLDISKVVKAIKVSVSKHRLLIIDACRTQTSRFHFGYLKYLIEKRFYMLFSSSQNESSYAEDNSKKRIGSEKPDMSYFTKHFVEGLAGKADNCNSETRANGEITLDEIYQYLSITVPDDVRINENQKQTPEILCNDTLDIVLTQTKYIPQDKRDEAIIALGKILDTVIDTWNEFKPKTITEKRNKKKQKQKLDKTKREYEKLKETSQTTPLKKQEVKEFIKVKRQAQIIKDSLNKKEPIGRTPPKYPKKCTNCIKNRHNLWERKIVFKGFKGQKVSLEFVLLPKGRLITNRRKITIPSFWISKYEITQKQWEAVMSYNPSFNINPQAPVERVTWKDVQEFIEYLEFNLSSATVEFRLPAMNEWEYAARANSYRNTTYYWGDRPEDACKHGNIADEEYHRKTKYKHFLPCNDGYVYTAPVNASRFLPNNFGIYNTVGNVKEWVYAKTNSEREQMVKGSSYMHGKITTSCTNKPRYMKYKDLGKHYTFVGFRLAYDYIGNNQPFAQ